jgi:hypothetical protein
MPTIPGPSIVSYECPGDLRICHSGDDVGCLLHIDTLPKLMQLGQSAGQSADPRTVPTPAFISNDRQLRLDRRGPMHGLDDVLAAFVDVAGYGHDDVEQLGAGLRGGYLAGEQSDAGFFVDQVVEQQHDLGLRSVPCVALALGADAMTESPSLAGALWAMHGPMFAFSGIALGLALGGLSLAAARARLVPKWFTVVGPGGAIVVIGASIPVQQGADGMAATMVGGIGFLAWLAFLVIFGAWLWRES